MPFLMGDVSASVKNIQPAGTIVKEMVQQAVEMISFTMVPAGWIFLTLAETSPMRNGISMSFSFSKSCIIGVKNIQPAGTIVKEMVQQAVEMLKVGGSYITSTGFYTSGYL
jgi:hypothetical protein